MAAPELTERTRSLILTQIKNNIAAELAAIRTDRADNTIATEPPQSYFIYDGAHTYDCPAVFVIADSGEQPIDRTGVNYLSALMKLFVSVVVQGQDQRALTLRTERYQSALYKILDQTVITDSVVKVHIWCKRFTFSPIYTKDTKSDTNGNFRKEVAIELEVKHWENPTS